MITNPENAFELLQNDIAAKIMATAPFSTLKGPDGETPLQVLTEDEGDIQFEFDAMIQQCGLAIVVHAPTGDVAQPDIGGTKTVDGVTYLVPLITKLGFDVWVSEAPVFNRNTMGANPYATGLRVMKAALMIMGILHGFQPQSIGSPIYLDGIKTQRERNYMSDEDKIGTLIVSRILHFIAPQVAAEIS